MNTIKAKLGNIGNSSNVLQLGSGLCLYATSDTSGITCIWLYRQGMEQARIVTKVRSKNFMNLIAWSVLPTNRSLIAATAKNNFLFNTESLRFKNGQFEITY